MSKKLKRYRDEKKCKRKLLVMQLGKFKKLNKKYEVNRTTLTQMNSLYI